MLFGPAYKGIPLVAVTAAALAIDHGINVPYAFNRKEAKAHGEGGHIVGAELSGKVLIVDDVITAGTAIREVLSLLSGFKQASAAGVVIGLDRCEKIADDLSASQSFSRDHQLPVLSIVTIEDLLQFLTSDEAIGEQAISTEVLAEMEAYWQRYGASTNGC
jgi:orotate phosphoribosyltransferase